MTLSPTLSVLFSTRNGAKTLPLMLESMLGLELDEPIEIVAIDNGSSDATRNILADFQDRLPITVLSEEKPGKNRALNKGIEHARGDLLVFTDDDIIADRAWLTSLREAASDQPDFSIFAGRIEPHWLSKPSDVVLKNAPLGVTYAITPEDLATGPIRAGLVWGPNMAVRRHVFDAGYRFDSSVGPSGKNYAMGSETEFTTRIAEHGYTCWFCGEALVQHIIRDYQIDPSWVIGRAQRFGRNQWNQVGGTEIGRKIAGIPRWRFSQYGLNWMHYIQACRKGDDDAVFRARWEISVLNGYFLQAVRKRMQR